MSQSSKPKKPRAKPIDQAIWESHKDRILQLWSSGNLTLSKVMEIVEAETGFVASKRQYYRQINQVWNVRSNFTAEELGYIGNMIRKRQATGRKTRVKLNGVLVPDKVLKRKESRIRVTTIDSKRKELTGQSQTRNSPLWRRNDVDIGTPSAENSNIPQALTGLGTTYNSALVKHSELPRPGPSYFDHEELGNILSAFSDINTFEQRGQEQQNPTPADGETDWTSMLKITTMKPFEDFYDWPSTYLCTSNNVDENPMGNLCNTYFL